ncbi:MAG TPA: HDOD domain-containing protein [Bryobacteraceae bacterium]|nr:HDOD domain-containing protein [Bryobacteraceae bacterium]
MDHGPQGPQAGRADLGVQAHCQRVAAWSSELAGALGLSPSERSLVEQAALCHHFSPIAFDETTRHGLLRDLKIEETVGQPGMPEEVGQLLQAFWGHDAVSEGSIAKLAAVLEMCDDFDQFFEAEPLAESGTADRSVNPSVETLFSYLQVTSRADVSRVIDHLPVFPRAAREVVTCVSSRDLSVRELEKVAALDPVMSGLLIQTANSGYYSPRSPIANIRHAISYIGVEATRKVLLAATFRSNFASMRMHQLWNHSLDVAETAERLAMRSRMQIDPSEAFLAGLVHDVGRLAFSIMPAVFLERFYRLTDRGCPAIEVEICLSGLCHGEVGAQTLVQWKFPGTLVEAVRWHHRPERCSSSLASLLYLAEVVSESEEDLPSAIRMRTACRLTGIDPEALADLNREQQGSLETLRFAA